MTDLFRWCLVALAAAATWAVIEVVLDGWCARRRRARLKRAASNFLGVNIAPQLSARAGTEKDTAAALALARVEAAVAPTDKHTGAGASDGDREHGPGVTLSDAQVENLLAIAAPEARDPQRCARCHHFHFDAGSLICTACRDALVARKGAA